MLSDENTRLKTKLQQLVIENSKSEKLIQELTMNHQVTANPTQSQHNNNKGASHCLLFKLKQ